MRGIHRWPVNSPHKAQRRGALMFSLICVCKNGWVNNREAGDLKRYRARYYGIVMWSCRTSRSSLSTIWVSGPRKTAFIQSFLMMLIDFWWFVNTVRPRQNGRHFADDTLQRIFLNEVEHMLISLNIKFVPEVRINNIPALVQIMAWCRSVEPLSEPMMASLQTHIFATRTPWVNSKKRR